MSESNIRNCFVCVIEYKLHHGVISLKRFQSQQKFLGIRFFQNRSYHYMYVANELTRMVSLYIGDTHSYESKRFVDIGLQQR